MASGQRIEASHRTRRWKPKEEARRPRSTRNTNRWATGGTASSGLRPARARSMAARPSEYPRYRRIRPITEGSKPGKSTLRPPSKEAVQPIVGMHRGHLVRGDHPVREQLTQTHGSLSEVRSPVNDELQITPCTDTEDDDRHGVHLDRGVDTVRRHQDVRAHGDEDGPGHRRQGRLPAVAHRAPHIVLTGVTRDHSSSGPVYRVAPSWIGSSARRKRSHPRRTMRIMRI